MARVQRANSTQRYDATASGADAGTARLSGGVASGLRSSGERTVDTVAIRVKQGADIGAAHRHATGAWGREQIVGCDPARDRVSRAGSGRRSARSVPPGSPGTDRGSELSAAIAAAGNGV